jgi:hypothetical protein
MKETPAGISIETLFHLVKVLPNPIIYFSWQKPLPLVTIKVSAFFLLALSICAKRQDSVNVDVNMGRAMIGRIKTFSLSTITVLSKEDIKYVIVKVLRG